MAKFFKLLKYARKLLPLLAFIVNRINRISSQSNKSKKAAAKNTYAKGDKKVSALEIVLVIISIACTAVSVTALVGCIRQMIMEKKSPRLLHPKCTRCKYPQIEYL